MKVINTRIQKDIRNQDVDVMYNIGMKTHNLALKNLRLVDNIYCSPALHIDIRRKHNSH